MLFKKLYFQTPDGLVSLRVWYALLEIEDTRSYGIKVNFKLRREHLEPKYYQKMNVALSFQVITLHSYSLSSSSFMHIFNEIDKGEGIFLLNFNSHLYYYFIMLLAYCCIVYSLS